MLAALMRIAGAVVALTMVVVRMMPTSSSVVVPTTGSSYRLNIVDDSGRREGSMLMTRMPAATHNAVNQHRCGCQQ